MQHAAAHLKHCSLTQQHGTAQPRAGAFICSTALRHGAAPQTCANRIPTRHLRQQHVFGVQHSSQGAQQIPCQRHRLKVCAAAGDGSDKRPTELGPERWKLYVSLVGVATVAALILTYGSEGVQDVLYGDGLDTSTSSGPNAGDVAGTALWGASLYYCSPLQLLLLFIGDINTERPSDWLLRVLGGATGQRIDDLEYSAPLALRAAVVAICSLSGAAIAWGFEAGLGDATWSVSTGLGACVASAVYEVGRPKRYSREEAEQLDAEWCTFVGFARERLQRRGQCHESEVAAAFRQAVSRFRSDDAMPDERIRDFVRNWAPDAQRTPGGFLKGVSLQEWIDPFSGSAIGTAAGSGSSSAAGGQQR